MTAPAPTPDLATRLGGRYRLERLLGRGGMGAVHLARDLRLDRLVAVKELPAEFASDPVLRERFLREVRMAASFSHPNIVPVYAVEEDEASLAFVMGFVEGESLAERVKRAGPLSSREAVRMLLDVTYALAYAHGRGVVHRDIKPDNIMIERATGRALIMDFGVARLSNAAPSASAGMTRVGEVVGTPEYMSPEQATGEEIDGRSDLYSLGLTAHFAVTGNIAYAGESAARILVRQLTEALPPISSVRPDLPSALGAAIDKSVAKDREDRFVDAAAMIEALDAAQAAAPEVPLAVRLVAAELTTLQMLLMFTLVVSAMALSALANAGQNLMPLLPCLVMGAVVTGRLLQARREVLRMRNAGFSTEDIHRGFLALMAEREERRQQLRADTSVVTARRSTVRAARLMLVAAAALLIFGLRTRYVADGRDVTPPFGIAMVFSAMISFGFGIVLLVRNPLAPSVDERQFRRIWMGPLGRWLLGLRRDASSATQAPVRTATLATSNPIDARVASLETRVAELERRARE